MTAHVMWTKPIEAGGLVGGQTSAVAANTYFEGSAYSQRYTNPIIVDGMLIYTQPISYTATTGGSTVAVDIQTGKVIWSRNDVPSLSFAYVYDVEDPNQHGEFPPILFTTNFARAFDAYTGDPMFNVSGVPTGVEAMGPQGEHLRYVLTNLGTTASPNYVLSEWNSSKLWTYTGLSPALVNASNSATWSMTGNVNNAAGTPTNYVNQAFTVDGSVFNSTDPNNRYDWNVSIPWRNTMATAPTVLSVFYNNMMICRSGTVPHTLRHFINRHRSSSVPYNYFAVNLNSSNTAVGVGGILWNYTVQPPTGNVTITYGGADPTVGVFTEGVKETMQWYGYSMLTGQRLGDQSATKGHGTISAVQHTTTSWTK